MTALDSSEQLQPLPIDQIPVDHVFMRARLDWMLNPEIPTVVHRLYAVYGPAVVTAGDDTHPPTAFQATLTPEYQAKLAEADKLAVRVGGNQPLRCVVFERKEDMEDWLQDNHGVQDTLITALQDASRWYVWLALETGLHVCSEAGGRVVWFGTGTNVEVWERNGPCHVVVGWAYPKMLAFEELRWSSCIDLRFRFDYHHVLGHYGEPVLENAHGKVVPNGHFWAGVIGRELGIDYSPSTDQFTVHNPLGDGSKPVPEEWVLKNIAKVLLSQSRQEGCEPIAGYRGTRGLKEIMEALKICHAREDASSRLTVDMFLRTSLTKEPGASVTSAELREAYQGACKQAGSPLLPDRIFYREAKQAILDTYGVATSHCIKRPGGDKNGYQGLRLKLAETGKEDA